MNSKLTAKEVNLLKEKVQELNHLLKALSEKLEKSENSEEVIAIAFQHNPSNKVDDVDSNYKGAGVEILRINK